ncbi:centrosomal protein kizuna isoform X3 [Ochotona curzoniae]|uniref:centrosomal protein kizuna isoform X3 n=1 Tax=Ochotona curzoniae TaxID=130825 RepID=UPI001B34B9CA|nr:centrosomal protein kizuna isoform X3 [Ochotona curzoniae]
MHRNPASSLPLASPDFYERLGHLQRGLRDSEKKRLDLEKKLCEYNQSDVYRNKLKYVKLKKYLKEICDSEKRAHARNKEYLKRLECVEAHVGRLATNTKKLQELKIEYETQIKKMQQLSKGGLGVKDKLKDPDERKERLSPENRTDDFKCDSCSRSEESEGGVLTQERIEVEEARASPPVLPVSVPEHCAADSRAREEHPARRASSGLHSQGELESQSPFQGVQDEEEESLSSSSDLTVSVSEDDFILKSPEPQPNPGDKMEGEDEIETLKLIHTKQKREALPTEEDKCAVQTVSSPGSEKEFSTKSPTRESEEAPDSGFLKAQLGDATLREQVRSPQEATAFLREASVEECADGSAVHSTESSCSLPPILNDDPGRKEAKPPLELHSVHAREQEVSSDCGDERKEDSMATAVPITETRVYQLLKMSALQDNRKQTEDRLPRAAASASQPSGLHVGSSAPQTKSASSTASGARDSSGEGSPLSRNENKKKLIVNLKSNVFWGESDDSNSDIEAALRPRNCDTSSDGFDDFYD